MSIEVIVISGAPADEWDECFLPSAQFDTNGNLVRGSLGVSYDIKQNLGNLFYETCKGDEKRFAIEIHNRYPNLSTRQINLIVKFLKFAEGNETMFAIKRGTTVQYIARRIGHYRYDPSNHYSHRISYEIVRSATAEEKNIRLAQDSVTKLLITNC